MSSTTYDKQSIAETENKQSKSEYHSAGWEEAPFVLCAPGRIGNGMREEFLHLSDSSRVLCNSEIPRTFLSAIFIDRNLARFLRTFPYL